MEITAVGYFGTLLLSGYRQISAIGNIGITVLGLSLVGRSYALRSEKPRAQFSVQGLRGFRIGSKRAGFARAPRRGN
jgi:hypothetical protein